MAIDQSLTDAQVYNYGVGNMAKCPPAQTEEKLKIAWLNRSLTNGQRFLQSNTASSSFESSINVIANRISEQLPKKLSRVKVNRLKRAIREIISTLTNINPRWSYGADNELLTEQVGILNKRLNSWWNMSFADRAIKEALQWGVLGAGWISPVWGIPTYGSDSPDVVLKVYSQNDVIPDQPHRNGDVQSAYVTHIRDTQPYAMACATYPEAASKLVPDRYLKTGGLNSTTALVARWAAPLFNAIGMSGVAAGMEGTGTPMPEIDVYYSYVNDYSINDTGRPIHTNEFTTGSATDSTDTKFTRWEYVVYPLGGEQPDGTFRFEDGYQTNPQTGQVELTQERIPNTKPVRREDAKLYPLRRLIIWTSTTVLYDGPSFWWHGKVPVVRFSLDKWPWEFLGFDIVAENHSILDALTSLYRGAVDMTELQMDPPLTFVEKEYGKEAMASLNLRVPGMRTPRTGMVTEPIKTVLPYQHYQLSQQWQVVVESLVTSMDYQIGVQDMTALAKLQQAPSAETIDRMLQAAGPLINDYAREMERAMTELGYMVMWLFLEFDTTARRMQILGRDGVTAADWDFEPGSLIPDNVPGLPDDAPIMRKGVLHGRRFRFNIVPRSIFQVTDIQNKLFLLQLWRDPKNFPIDPWTLAEAWNLPDFGELPANVPSTIMGRWTHWMEQITLFQVALQTQAQLAMAQGQMGIQQQMNGMIGQSLIQQAQAGMGATGPEGEGGPGEGTSSPQGGAPSQAGPMASGEQNVGRPPSGDKMPRIESKDGGARSTISES